MNRPVHARDAMDLVAATVYAVAVVSRRRTASACIGRKEGRPPFPAEMSAF